MHPWPELELTNYERHFVRYYKTWDAKANCYRPGVLKRVYEVVLNSVAIPSAGFTVVNLAQSLQISRRSRVFGLTFVGDPASWLLTIRTATGEQFTNGQCLVSAMCACSPYNVRANIGEHPASNFHHQAQSGLLGLDPSWELMPNETLIFEGALAPPLVTESRVLMIGIHVWEFPGMEVAAAGA